ncbi:beta-lactamase [Mycena amicta]|nr:beta-lactamase [Mycena amicta]
MPAFTPAQKAKFDEIITEAIESKALPALSFAVTDADGVLYSRQSGHAIFDDATSKAVDKDTIFWFCSQTKLIAVLQLIEQGKLSLSTPVTDILPELATPVLVTSYDPTTQKPTASTPATTSITINHLLNHSSGLDYFITMRAQFTGPRALLSDLYAYEYALKEKKGEELKAFFREAKGDMPDIPLRFEPGTNFAYSFGTDCLGFIVERASGQSLEAYFQEHIFAPLGITSLSFHLDTLERKSRLLPLTYRNPETSKLERWSFPPVVDTDSGQLLLIGPLDLSLKGNLVRLYLGGVGLYGTQEDYLTILRHLLQLGAGRATTSSILSKSSVDLLFTPSLPESALLAVGATAQGLHPRLGIPDGAAQFSLGLLVNTVDVPNKRRAGTGSWSGWANTSFFIDPASGVAVVVGTQLVPVPDAEFDKVSERLEKAVYEALGA